MQPSLAEFQGMAQDSRYVPLWQEVLADTETPISLYLRLARGSQGGFLLESAEGGARLGRYSVIGLDPILRFTSRGRAVQIDLEDGARESHPDADPFVILADLLARLHMPRLAGLPRFAGGLVGYLGYDMVRHLERLPAGPASDLDLPDALLYLHRFYLIYDHLRRTLLILCLADARDGEAAYSAAAERLASLQSRISRGEGGPHPGQGQAANPARAAGEVLASMSREGFIDRVERIKEYIAAGDCLQVVLSQRLALPFTGRPLDVYRRLRSLNPSPYLFYLDFPGVKLVGSSPEMLVRVEDGLVENRPIAGTRPRGRDAADDRALAAALAADPKERAEHLMLVDLARNDVGRIAAPGSVQVPEFMQVENYSHVMHLVSSVTGRLAPGLTALDALKACFPAGTVSGAPKVRAMAIIDELEPVRRGPYAGAVGYLGLNGNLDTCIAIRTLVLTGGQAYVQAGAGVVADSVPAAEYQETLLKAEALKRVVKGAV